MMTKTNHRLNGLGLSSFSALLLMGQSAYAEPTPPTLPGSPLYSGYLTTAPAATDLAEAATESCTCQELTDFDLNSDFIGDLAIEQMGCDCAGCRFTVRQAQASNFGNQ